MKKIKKDSFGNITVSRMNMYWKLVKHKIKKKNKYSIKPKLYLLWATKVKTFGSKA